MSTIRGRGKTGRGRGRGTFKKGSTSMRPGTAYAKSQLEAVPSSDARDLRSALSIWAARDYDLSLLDVFAFQGMSLDLIYKHVYARGLELGLSSFEETFTPVGTLIGLGAMKGQFSANNWGRMSDDGKRAANKLMQDWGIVVNIKANKTTGVSIPRLVAAFPGMASLMYNNVSDYIGGPFDVSGIFSAIRCSSFPGIIPRDFAGLEMLVRLVELYSANQTLVFGDREQKGVWTKEQKDAAMLKQKKFINIALNSVAQTPDERDMYFLGILEPIAPHACYTTVVAALSVHATDIKPITETEWDASLAIIQARSKIWFTTANNDFNDKLKASRDAMAAIKAFDRDVKKGKRKVDDPTAPSRIVDFKAIEVPEASSESEAEAEDDGSSSSEDEADADTKKKKSSSSVSKGKEKAVA